MALTAQVKDEVARFDVIPGVRPEGGGVGDLRFSGALHLSADRSCIEAELDTAAAARSDLRGDPRTSSGSMRISSSINGQRTAAGKQVHGPRDRQRRSTGAADGSRSTPGDAPCADSRRPSSTAPWPTARPRGEVPSSLTAP